MNRARRSRACSSASLGPLGPKRWQRERKKSKNDLIFFFSKADKRGEARRMERDLEIGVLRVMVDLNEPFLKDLSWMPW